MNIVYARALPPLDHGDVYQNPRFFTAPLQAATHVVIHGDWPQIAAHYEAAGVPVKIVDNGDGGTLDPAPVVVAPDGQADDRRAVLIPHDWRDLSWSKPSAEGLTLRGLASSLSLEPVLNKDAATTVIEAELARRDEE